MAESVLAALLAQKQPAVEDNQALIVFGLQNDFVGPNPKVPLSLESGWVERIKDLVPKFREFAGDIIFIRSEVAQDSLGFLDGGKVILSSPDPDGGDGIAEGSKDRDEDKSPSKGKKKGKRNRVAQFLKDMRKSESADVPTVPVGSEVEEIYRNREGDGPCCEPGSIGAALRSDIQALVQPEDMIIVKPNFSAFSGTNLLIQLRMKIVTELYLVGCLTNMSIFATAQEAASHGFVLNIVEDCLGYKSQTRHDIAMSTMQEQMGAYTTTSSAILAAFEDPSEGAAGAQTPTGARDADDPFGLNAALGALGLEGKDRSSVQSQDMDVTALAESLATSSLNRRSLNSPTPPQAASASRPPTAGAASEAQSPLSSKGLRSFRSTPDIRNRANVRVRVRKRTEAELPKVPELPKAALHAKTLSREDENAKMIQSILEAKQGKGKEGSPQKKGEVTAYWSTLFEPHRRQKDAVPNITQSTETRGPLKAFAYLHSQPTTSAVYQATASSTTELDNKRLTALDKHQKQLKQKDTMNNQPKIPRKFKNLSNLLSLGPDDTIGEGDSSIKYNLLGEGLHDELDPSIQLSKTIFRAIDNEVEWQKMYHAAGEVPRLVAVQGTMGEDGSKPVYRHPSDQAPPLLPFTKHVDIVRHEAEKVVGHRLNHVLIQLYRTGQDYISEHSDKTLDIAKGSSIVNASFGAQRTMRLRTKKTAKKGVEVAMTSAGDDCEAATKNVEVDGVDRVTQRIHMPHNSLFVLGLKTNRFWLHGINQDKRADRDRSPEELANNSMRISLTFRLIDTFLSADESLIWGQGAKSKSKDNAGSCINANESEADKMIDAFGFENKEGADFDWDKVYGEGFDVLNMRAVNAPAVRTAAGASTARE